MSAEISPEAEEGVPEETGPLSPVTYILPDTPYDEMNPLDQRWSKIKGIPEFPFIVKYYGDCGLPLEYCEFLPEPLRVQAMEASKTNVSIKISINKF